MGPLLVLIVDDDPLVCQTLRACLDRLGHMAVAVENGLEAVQAALRGAFDLAIVDLVLGSRSGLDVIQQLRAFRPDLAIVAMSGDGREVANGRLRRARKLGANQVLAKPFGLGQIEAAIDACRECHTGP